MRIAYAILVHRYPQQFGRLLQALSLNAGHVEFFVHIDGKSPSAPFHNAVGEAERPKVHFIDRRTNVNWGGFSQVRAILMLMQEIVKSKRRFDYIILLSGQDYPIKSNEFIHTYLTCNAGCEFIQHVRIPDVDWNVVHRIEEYHFYDFVGRKLEWYFKRTVGRFLPAKRRFPSGFSPFGGSSWWGLTMECVEFILDFITRSRSFVRFFWFTHCPDEMFFHTIIANSRFSERVRNERLTYVDWTLGQTGPKI